MGDDLPLLNGVRSFVAAAQELSFSRAAVRLGVTPGAVSRMVRKLEDHLGQRLLDRRAHGLALTSQGEVYFRDVAGPLAAIGAATRRLAGTRDPGRIVVACYPTFAARWLLPRWNRFFNRHPDIDVQLATSLSDVDFRRDEAVDIAIRLGTAAELGERTPGLVREKLFEIEMVPVAEPRLFAGCRTEARRVQRLAELVLIHSRPLPGEWRNWLSAYRRSMTDPRLVQMIDVIDASSGPNFETLNLSFQAAAEGIGVAVGIEAFVRDDVEQGTLVVPIAFRRHGARQFQVVARSGSHKARAIELYRKWLQEEGSLQGKPRVDGPFEARAT